VLHKDKKANQIIDGNPKTQWAGPKKENNKIVIDLGETLELTGFTYLPMQQRWISGFIKEYEFSTSMNKRNWKQAATGEFGNIQNSPILQQVSFPKQIARYIKLEGVTTVDGKPAMFAEVGVLTK